MKYRKILVAIDDGPLGDRVAREGYELAQQLRAEVALVSVADPALTMSDGNVTPADLTKMLKRDFKDIHKNIIEQVLEDKSVRSFVEEGKPWEAIISTARAWDADAIVLGTHGRTGLSHLLMGSVAEHVIRHWAKPTFIIPRKS